jgi:uncharacterized protein YicC (UPF0701 family)
MNCYFKRGKITCARTAVKVIAVKRGAIVSIRWELCDEHTASATREAMDYAAVHGGSLHTARITGPKVKSSQQASMTHVYLRIPRILLDRMIKARQKRGMASNAFITEAIDRLTTEIEEGK